MRKTEEFSYFLSSLAEWKMRKGSEILTYRAAVPTCRPDDNYIFFNAGSIHKNISYI